ncbi:MAG: CCA tRNA nucleotidyltransferase [Clostridiales bacterium]|nr:CCA tRNA nucleotidyltransferase [Clostridiales bacterium]
MKVFVNKKLQKLSTLLDGNIYIVGGFTRNFLITGKPSGDIDLATPLKKEELLPKIKELFTKIAEYENTGTIKFSDEETNEDFELTTFRKESYRKGGTHTPEKIEFTTDITEDAKRRDFKINAIYYDIKEDKIIDPLGGIEDIKNKTISTTSSDREVFSEDGLRLMRLARLKGELGFEIEEKTLLEAKKYAKNILDISKERIFDELNKILVADTKYPFSPKYAHYDALMVLNETRVLDYIIPELTEGRFMEQRKDFHKYDVLTHSLKSVQYADKSIRLTALLHDVGKPYCMKKFSKYHEHAKYGEIIAGKILNRLKAPKKVTEKTKRLISLHMLDMKEEMKENKIRRYIALNADIFNELMLLKQADFTACKDDFSINQTVIKWRNIYKKMKEENLPLSIKELKISGEDLIGIVPDKKIGLILKELLFYALNDKNNNQKEKLIKEAIRLKERFDD